VENCQIASLALFYGKTNLTITTFLEGGFSWLNRRSHPFGVASFLVRRSKNEKVICWLVGLLFQFSNFLYFNMEMHVVKSISVKNFKLFLIFLFKCFIIKKANICLLYKNIRIIYSNIVLYF